MNILEHYFSSTVSVLVDTNHVDVEQHKITLLRNRNILKSKFATMGNIWQ